jgi:uncharacterized protein YjgD (DUF1641 family)
VEIRKMSNWHYIDDIETFLDQIRNVSFDKFLEVNKTVDDEFTNKLSENTGEIDLTISISEVENIAMPFLKKKNGKYKISDKILQTIIEKINSRMISNSLNKLVSDGIVESAFDSELNDFVFWLKEDN